MTTVDKTEPVATKRVESAPPRGSKTSDSSVMLPWLRAQSINVTRHAAALRPFGPEEFGVGAAAPTPGHLQAVNHLITGLRRDLLKMSGRVRKAAVATTQDPTTRRLQQLMIRKAHAHHWV